MNSLLTPEPRAFDTSWTVHRRLVVFLLGVATIAVAMAQGPVAGVLLPASVAAARMLRTACWIHAADPDSVRRRVAIVYCVAAAMWQATAAALVTLLVLVVVTAMTGGQPDPGAVIATLLLLLGGTVATAIVRAVAIAMALRNRQRVWIHPNLPNLLDDDLRPIHSLATRVVVNHAWFVTGITVCLAVLIPPCLIACVAMSWTTAVLMVLSPLLALLAYARVQHRIAARSIYQCWGPPHGLYPVRLDELQR